MGIFGRRKRREESEVLNISGRQLIELLNKSVQQIEEEIGQNCYSVSSEIIFEYNPNEPTWWITGFNPDKRYQDRKESELEVEGSICFKDNPQLWEDFYNEFKDEEGWCFNEETKTAYYKW